MPSTAPPESQRHELSADERRTLLSIARRTLVDLLTESDPRRHEASTPALREERPAFVTLRRRDSGELRGCRGECVAQRPLIESVVYAAIAAATDDPRFPPVTLDELPALRIEISALTAMSPIRPEDVVVGRHGLMIVSKPKSGLLLPQVAVTYGWDRHDFLRGLCRKAGLSDRAWESDDVQLYAFESDVWSEDE